MAILDRVSFQQFPSVCRLTPTTPCPTPSQALRQQGRSWREMYWFTWGLVVFLYCTECQARFPMRQLHHCLYHSQLAAKGLHPCCQRPVWTTGRCLLDSLGCCIKQHSVIAPLTDEGLRFPRALQWLALCWNTAMLRIVLAFHGYRCCCCCCRFKQRTCMHTSQSIISRCCPRPQATPSCPACSAPS